MSNLNFDNTAKLKFPSYRITLSFGRHCSVNIARHIEYSVKTFTIIALSILQTFISKR